MRSTHNRPSFTTARMATTTWRACALVLGGAALSVAGCAGGAGSDQSTQTGTELSAPSVIAGDPGNGRDYDRRLPTYGWPVPLTNARDVRFIDFTVPHHEDAMMMADQVIERGVTPAVVEFARSMREMQTKEVEELKAIRKELTGTAHVPPPPPDPHMDRDMSQLMQLSGVELEQTFLKEMIPHHSGIIEVSHRSMKTLQHPELRDMAKDMFEMQSKEICTIEQLRGK